MKKKLIMLQNWNSGPFHHSKNKVFLSKMAPTGKEFFFVVSQCLRIEPRIYKISHMTKSAFTTPYWHRYLL